MIEKEILRSIARARADQESASADMKALLDAVKERADYKALEAKHQTASQSEQEQTAGLHAFALRQYEQDQTKTKHEAGAYEIKKMTRLEYDEEKARTYCLASMQAALKVDKTTFEKIAKLGTIPGGIVTIKTVPQVFVKQDLSAYLEG